MASINGSQVTDYLRTLQDSGKIQTERIGNGSWYWSFPSEEKKHQENTLARLRDEKAKLDVSLQGLNVRVKEAARLRDEQDGRGELTTLHDRLEEEIKILKIELETYKDVDPRELDRKKEEIKAQKQRAERWTDNIQLLEGWISKALGGDREGLENLRRECYGGEYVEGEGGLTDL